MRAVARERRGFSFVFLPPVGAATRKARAKRRTKLKKTLIFRKGLDKILKRDIMKGKGGNLSFF